MEDSSSCFKPKGRFFWYAFGIQTKRTVPLVCEEFSEKVVVKADQTTYTLPQLTPKP
ncbi:MAG: hypothetical protein MR656_09690 [Bacteroidales bacterium]|nr:hypothetical protein [Muribaculaceae bacterium]MCI6225375.1 hypothetical protein [Bacteroidales bacterium]MCI6656568.1 hypothetical protein [Bacteroidales bacterium]MCI7317868.1 hypothetical protein [Bacteroidales bacterium]